MADTLPNVTLPQDTWVDLYAATGIVVGTQINVQNIGSNLVLLYTGATAPTEVPGNAYTLLAEFEFSQNKSGDSGAWALCRDANGRVNVGEM